MQITDTQAGDLLDTTAGVKHRRLESIIPVPLHRGPVDGVESRVDLLIFQVVDGSLPSTFEGDAKDVLMQELRLQAALTDCARAQVWTLRERLLKLGARVVGSTRRVVVHLPESFPFLKTFQTVALELGAAAT